MHRFLKKKKVPIDDEPPLLPTSVSEIHAYEWTAVDKNDDAGDEVSEINIWCMDRGDGRYLLRVTPAPVFCYIILPKIIGAKRMIWTDKAGDFVFEHLRFVLKSDAPSSYRFCHTREIYGYQGDLTTPALLMHFKTHKAMSHCANLLNKPLNIKQLSTMTLTACEHKISMIRKILSLRNMQYSQWFSVPEAQEILVGHPLRISVPGKDARIREFLIKWEHITPLDVAKTRGWISRPWTLAFDLETYTDNHKRFCDALIASNCVYMNQMVFQKGSLRHTRRRFVIIMGDCDEMSVGPDTVVVVNGQEHRLDPTVKIYRVTSELELVKAFGAIIMDCDPDIITGFNSSSFDWSYLATRIAVFNMADFPQMGRLLGKTPVVTKQEWASGAYGKNVICNVETEGRIHIDMLLIVKRNYKLDKYTLDHVCRYFLKRGKHDVKPHQMFETFEFMQEAKKLKDQMLEEIDRRDREEEKGEDSLFMPSGQSISFEQIEAIWNSAKTRMTKVVAYGVEDSELVIDLFDLLHTWIGLVELSSIVGVTITELFTRGQQIRCQSQIYDTAMKNGFVLNKRIAEKLFVSGGFVGEPIPGLFTRILCFDFSSLYPSIIRAYNICFTTFVTGYSDADVTDDMCNVIEFDQEEDPKFKGGVDTGKESEGASDFVAKEEDDEEDETKVKKTVTKHYRFRFLKEEYRKGLLPTILSNLIGERKAVKAQIKILEGQLKQFELILVAIKSALDSKIGGDAVNELQQRFATQLDKYDGSNIDGHREDLGWSLIKIRQVIEDIDTELIILNERQGSLKVSANSLYGFLGVQNGGMMPLIEAAMAVTAIGRTLINKVNVYLEEKYGAEVKYNDTDSSMVDMHLEKDTDCHPWGIRIAQEISGIPEQRAPDGTLLRARMPGLFPPPLEVEYEKGMTVLLIKKKKYAYLSIGKDGNYLRNPDTGDLIISVKGIVPARRDNFAFLRETYMRMLSDILLFKPIDVGFGHIVDCVNMMFKGELRPRGNLTVIKQLGSDYKAENYFMKVFSDELARIGKPAAPGERLEYVVVRTRAEIENDEVVKLGLKMRDIDMWEDSWKFKHGSTPMVEDKKEQADLVALPEVFASILGIKTEKNDAPVYDADEIDYLYYVEHFLMNSLDQLFSVGYGKELAKYSGIGYSPAYSRCHYCSVQTPIKMIVKLINDFNKGGEDYLPVLAGLKQWFIDSRHQVDLMPDDDDEVAPEPSPVKKFRLKTVEPSPVKKFRLKTAEPSPVKKFRLKTVEPSPVKKFRLKTASPRTDA